MLDKPKMHANEDDFVVPYHIVDERLGDDVDTEQHKARRGDKLRRRSIRHYRHATTQWGAALESFGPMWVSPTLPDGQIPLGPF